MIGAAAMIAHHVGGKAIRDALFISNFGITALPTMVMGASLFSIVAVMLTSRAMVRFTPARFVPIGFAVSAVLFLVSWGIFQQAPGMAAVLIYLQVVGLGSVLTSGFWTMVTERFDAHTAKRQIGRIAAGGTLGGIIGGLVAERLSTNLGMSAMLPVLALYHVVCVFMVRGLKRPGETKEHQALGSKAGRPASHSVSVMQMLRGANYMRPLAALVLLGTVSAAMVDYILKSQAAAAYGRGPDLVRFFALFYSGVAVLNFLVQTTLTRVAIQKLGVAKTVATLPLAVCLGGMGALAAPGLLSAGIARALEAIFRGSLFRSGYELFYTPMPAREKRAAKSIVDVGFDRLGDAVGNGFVKLLLPLGPALASRSILLTSIAVALAGLWLASRLHRAYIGVLERGLMDRAGDLNLPAQSGETLMMTGMLQSSVVAAVRAQAAATAPAAPVKLEHKPAPAAGKILVVDETPTPGSLLSPLSQQATTDSLMQKILDLRSGDTGRVQKVLYSPEGLTQPLVSHAIHLLAWDQVYGLAAGALVKAADKHIGQLLDALVDPDTDFTIRRRIPKLLHGCRNPRVVEGLMASLKDRRFEVRFRSGRALISVVGKNPQFVVRSESVIEAVDREVAVGKPVWESHRVLDKLDDEEASVFVDEFLRDRAKSSLEHVFNLLSLVLPRDPLKIAFHGLHTEDKHLRATALEYLESILPVSIREKMLPFISDHRPAKASRPREDVLNELMLSNQSIMINLQSLRKKAGGLKDSGTGSV